MGAPNTLRRFSHGAGKCDWDGQTRQRVFSYGQDGHTFCNVECFQSFHGVSREWDYIEPEVRD